ncbi:alpha/beta fold hydrolase [Psychrobacillus sp. BM2]|uniref:alpha/beta fold hydrolase n=1 Tax=Psychrobacillus sp. BM2 TaxID=3400421 RepID=UPI003B0185C6
MDKKTFNTSVNGVNFYCEMRGNGPTMVLIPDGSNDCEPYDDLSKLLASDFTVLTFDMRGGSRSLDPNPKGLSPKVLADDVAGIITSLNLGPASIYGCSSGGQAALALGKYHPNLVKNLMVHEAALQADAPLENSGFAFFENYGTFGEVVNEVSPMTVWSVGNLEKWRALGDECHKRIEENGAFWSKYYLGFVDKDVYSEDDFKKMPPTSFSVGAWTPSWLVYANIVTAQRGNCPVTWLNCAHHPEIVCPEELATYIRNCSKEYVNI